MRIYGIKMFNFMRFGETENSLVFDITKEQKDKVKKGELTFDSIYQEITEGPAEYVEAVNKIEDDNVMSGIVGIAGQTSGSFDASNGSGKSTIFEAISYLMYDRVVRQTANTDKKAPAGVSVVTKLAGKYPEDLKESYVEAYFEEDDKLYRLKRGRSFTKKQKTNSAIFEFECILDNDVDKLGGHRKKDTKESLEEVIVDDYDIFVNTVMFGQNDAGKFLVGTDKVKKDMIIELLKLDDIVHGCVEVIRGHKKENTNKLNDLVSRSDSLKSLVVKSMKEFDLGDEDVSYSTVSSKVITDFIDGKIDEQNVLKDDISKQIEGIDNGITSIEESDTIKKISALTDEGKALVTQRKEKEEKRDRDLKDWKKILKESEASLINFKRLVHDDTKSIETNTKRVESENLLIGMFDEKTHNEQLEKCEKADQLTEKYEGVLKNVNEKRDNTVQKIADFGAAITHRYVIRNDLNAQLSKAVEGKFICGECQSTVTKEHIDQKIAESDALIKTNSEGKDKLETTLVKIEEAKVSTEKRLKQINEYKLQHQQLIEEKSKYDKAKVDVVTYTEWLDNAKTTLKSYEDNIVTLTNKVNEYTEKCDNIDKEYHASVIEINIEIEKKREEIKSLNEDANKLKEELKVFRLLKEKKTNSIQEIDKACGSLAEKMAGVVDLDLQIVDHEETITLVRKDLQRYAILESSFGLGGVQTRVVARYLPLLNDYVKKYLNILSDGKLSVKVFVNSKTKVDMEIVGGTADSYVMLSGGEKMIVRLAVDIGLSLLSFYRTQKVPDMICLDEIFGPLDKNRTKSVFLMLEELKTRFNRVFLISHKSEIQALVEDNIIVEKNAGNLGLSKITEISEITV